MSLIDQIALIRVLCVGDVMLDRFVNGSVRRISPESPVPVLSVTGTTAFPGGAANVARNISALGGRCTLISVVGDDAVGNELEYATARVGGIECEFVRSIGLSTTEKIRFVAQGQHLLRADNEVPRALSAPLEEAVLERVGQRIGSVDVLVLSDYAKGVLTPRVVAGCIAIARAAGKPCVVDPKSPQMERYSGATIVTPNAREVFEATGLDATDDDDIATKAGKLILERSAIDMVLLTRAHRGMTLVPRDGLAVHVPATAREVYDVVGAGDTVVAALSLALGAGAPAAEAARLANLAAGIVVGKRGTAVVTPSELRDESHRVGLGALSSLREKVLDLPALSARIAQWRAEGATVGFTNGCFDILHVGHLSILGFARAQCTRLVVGLNSDASVRRLKGASRPINSETDRAMVLGALAAVDGVVVFDEDTPLELIRRIGPDVLIKGADYAVKDIVGADWVLGRGGRVVTGALVPDRSTTRLVDALRGTDA